MGWNYRGYTSKDKLNRIRRLMSEYHIDVFALVETWANEKWVHHLCSFFAKNWNWAAIPADGYSEGIIVLWVKHLGRITPVVHSRRAIHLIFSSSTDHPWIILWSIMPNSPFWRRNYGKSSHWYLNLIYHGLCWEILMLSCRLLSIRKVISVIMPERLIYYLNSFLIMFLLMSVTWEHLFLGAMGKGALPDVGLGLTDA